MKINLTSNHSAIALCAVAVLSFLPTTQAGPNPINRKIAIDERGVPPIVLPGGDPISNLGNINKKAEIIIRPGKK